jgi:diguanylate cyclase (GGDEF)-like protein
VKLSQTPIQRSSEIEQEELRGFARSVAEVEWLLLILVLLFLFVSQPPTMNRELVVATLIGFAGFILLFRYTRFFKLSQRLKLGVEAMVMVGFLTAVLAQIGNEQTPLVNLYLLPIIVAALALGTAATVLVVALVCVCYMLLGSVTTALDIFTLPFLSRAMGVLSPFLLVAFLTTLLSDNIKKAKAQIHALSDQDELTTVYNMRAFVRLVQREHQRAKRTEQKYSIAMIDVDRLKNLNDIHGHEAGNCAINMVADALLRVTRSSDIVGRYGGDEFIVFLADADKYTAEEVAQRVRNVVYSTTVEVGSKMERISVSVGVATFPGDGASLDNMIASADKAMYADKEYRAPPPGKLVIQKR